MSRLRKRKVTVVFESRNPENPKAVLDAVEAAFRASEVKIVIRDGVNNADDASDEKPFHNDQAEQKAKDKASKKLDAKAEKAAHRDADGESRANRDVVKDAEIVVNARRSIWQRVKDMAQRGYEITVYQVAKAVLDTMKKDAGGST